MLCLFLVCAAACRSGDGEPLSRTDIARAQVNPQATNFLIQAQQALDRGILNRALAFADSAVALEPDLADAHFMRGRTLAAARQYGEAEQSYNEALARDPAYVIARFDLGNIAYGQDRFQEALTRYLEILEVGNLEDVGPEDLPASLEKDRITASLVQIGRTYVKLGAFDEARNAYDLALVVDSTDAMVHNDFGIMLRDDGDISRAILHARKALDLEPAMIDYRYFLGALLVQQGRYEDAIPYLEQVIAQRPWQQGAHFNLGQALIRTSQTDAGMQMLALADSVQLWQTDIDQTKANVDNDANRPENWIELGKAYLRAGRYVDAAEAFQYVLQFLPEHEAARYNMAVVWEKTGEVARARQLLRGILKTNPSHKPAQALLDQLKVSY
ncbi:MAG: tetratricopeptide repeat protein [Bacteroidota bacterium]